MLHDWGSRDQDFIDTNTRVCERLLAIANASETHVCVPLQGSGTFIVEAGLCTLIPADGKALILVNGAYGKRMAKILDYASRSYLIQETPEDQAPNIDKLDKALAADVDISHVLAVHCETTSGILNPIQEIANIVKSRGRSLFIDAMSAFGAISLDANHVYPPTHVIAAFDKAIEQFEAEGGVAGRFARYSENCRILTDGMRELGFETLLTNNLQAPIIVTFKMPSDPAFDFPIFYDHVKERGFVLYPGKLTVAPSFRVGCIGHLNANDIRQALKVIKDTLDDMGVHSGAPAQDA